jgi:zinc-finger binding domain of transposase IS66
MTLLTVLPRLRTNNLKGLGATLTVELIADIDDKSCLHCQRELHCIGEDKSERLDIVPAQLRLVTVRPKYICRKCEDGVLQAAAILQVEACTGYYKLARRNNVRPHQRGKAKHENSRSRL